MPVRSLECAAGLTTIPRSAERLHLSRRMRPLGHVWLRDAHHGAAQVVIDRVERGQHVFGQGQRDGARGSDEFARPAATRHDFGQKVSKGRVIMDYLQNGAIFK